MQRKTFATVVRATGDAPSVLINTGAVDRDGEIVEPSGIDLTNYRKNPVVLFGHDYSALPVGATTDIAMTPQGLRATWRWLENDPMADRVRNAWDQRVLGAASVGFIPITTEPLGNGRLRYTKWQLLEFSLVGVPSNPEATRTLKRLGLSVADDDVVLTLRDDEPATKSGRRHSAADLKLINRIHADAVALGSPCAAVDDPDYPGFTPADDDGKTVEFSAELVALAKAAHERQQRTLDDLWTPAVVKAALTDAVAAFVRHDLRQVIDDAAVHALKMARGRVD